MLKEIRNHRLTAERRRWFTDEYMDLYLWLDDVGSLKGFQLCFDKLQTEKALTWLAPRYVSLAEVDQGEDSPLKNMSPVLVASRSHDLGAVLHEFQARSKEIEPAVAEQVKETIEEMANKAL